MNADLITKLALIYVEKNLQPGDAPSRALALYNDAVEKFKEESDTLSKRIESGEFSF